MEKTLNLDENKYVITFEGNVNELPENPGTGKIIVHNMRADGFASLCTDDITKPASVITREKIQN